MGTPGHVVRGPSGIYVRSGAVQVFDSSGSSCCCGGSCTHVWLIQMCGAPKCRLLVCEGLLPSGPSFGLVARSVADGTCWVLLARFALDQLPTWAGDLYSGAFIGWVTCDDASCCDNPICNPTHCGSVDVATNPCDFAGTVGSILARRSWTLVSGTIENRQWNEFGASLGMRRISWSILSRHVTAGGGGTVPTCIGGSLTGVYAAWRVGSSVVDGESSHTVHRHPTLEGVGSVNLDGFCPDATFPPSGELSVAGTARGGNYEVGSDPFGSGSIPGTCPMCVTRTPDVGSPFQEYRLLDLYLPEVPSIYAAGSCNDSGSMNTVVGGTGDVGSYETTNLHYGNARFTSHLERYVSGVKREQWDVLITKGTLIDWCNGAQNEGDCG